MTRTSLADFLNAKVEQYNQPLFIKEDPVSIPHLYTKRQDIEIAGFFAAVFAWGNRTTIIKKAQLLMRLMDNAPHEFCISHHPKDLKKLLTFTHRTFNSTDLLYFIAFLRSHYREEGTMETAFTRHGNTVEDMLKGFHHYFFSLEDVPARTKKHIATPERRSTCKRLNMFLRWMVRKDNKGVDFGIWDSISPSRLICPVDLHVARVARKLGILNRKQTDWQAALELTVYLRTLDLQDPVRYDFALFGLGVTEKY